MAEIQTKIKTPALVQKRRKSILKAALKSFHKKGFHATTMRDISRESGINIASLYDYVSSKQDILTLMYDEMMKDVHLDIIKKVSRHLEVDSLEIDSLNKNRREKVARDYLTTYLLEGWSHYPTEVLVLYRESFLLDRTGLKRVLAADSEFVRRIAQDLAKICGLRSLDGDHINILANLFVYLLAFMPNRGWNVKGYDFRQVVDVTVDLFMRALGYSEASPRRNSGRGNKHQSDVNVENSM